MNNNVKIDYILQHLTSLLKRDSDQILLEQLGIGYSQYKILRILTPSTPVKQRFIADTLGQTEASISRQIDILIDKDLISKRVDPRNKKVRLIVITPRGKKIVDASNEVLTNYHKDLYSGFSNKQQDELLKLLKQLHSKICHNDHSLEPDYITYLTQN